MARGRKGESDEVKRAKGNPGRRPLAETQPQAAMPLPPVKDAAPRSLSKAGREVWGQVAKDLARMQFFRATDVQGLARYCENLANWWDIERKLRRQKLTYETDTRHGKMKRVNPLFTVQNALEKRLVALEDRLGLSPRARQEILRSLAAQPGTLPFPTEAGAEESDLEDPDFGSISPVGMLNRGTDAIQ